MKQISVTYENDASLLQQLEKVQALWEECGRNTCICKILSVQADSDFLQHISQLLDEALPEVQYYGCTCNGIIDNSKFHQKPMLSFTIYEDPASRAEILQFDDFEEDSLGIAARLVAYCHANPWLGSLEIITSTLQRTNLSEFCRALEVLDPAIAIFGGVSCTHDIAKIESLSFSKGHSPCGNTLLAVARGGSNLYTTTAKVYGWIPMGREFTVTKCHDGILYELDHEPAFNIYRKYLDIEPDENLFTNVIEFPLYLQRRGQTVMLCSFDVNSDSSLNIKADIPVGTGIRLSYGDPATLLNEVYDTAADIAPFTPQYIDIFSCGARRAFLGDKMLSYEYSPFNAIAPTTGLYSHGEIIRTGRTLLNYNELMVIAAFREGPVSEPAETKPDTEVFIDRRNYSLRLSHFIRVASQELEESIKQLRHMAITDGLTQLYNRKEIQRRVEAALDRGANSHGGDSFSLVMADIDNFKAINDTYGHNTGDSVLRKLSDILREAVRLCDGASCGRWGGEEFMLLLPRTDRELGQEAAEKIRTAFEQTKLPDGKRNTISLGVTEFKNGDTSTSIISRVDKALYIAKNAGKNRVCLL